MRIVVFAPHFAEYATRLAVALSRDGDVLLVSEAANTLAECEGLEIASDAPRLTRMTYRANLALRERSIAGYLERRRIFRAIKAFAPNVIHIQEQGDPFTVRIAEEAAAGHTLVLTVHDPVPHSGNDALVAQQFADKLARLRRAASAYHVHGAYCEAALRRRLSTSKPIVATTHAVILVPTPGALRPEGDRYLFFGRMEAYKGLDTLLDAIDLLPADHGLRFTLAGRGPELERWRTRAITNPAIDVVDKFLPPLEAIRHFQDARAIVVPYHDATQSGVIAAAVGNGRPVIASRVGGLVDAVGQDECGLLVPPDDPSALAAALLAMADPKKRQRFVEGVSAAANTRFAWLDVASRMRGFYEELLSDPTSSQAARIA